MASVSTVNDLDEEIIPSSCKFTLSEEPKKFNLSKNQHCNLPMSHQRTAQKKTIKRGTEKSSSKYRSPKKTLFSFISKLSQDSQNLSESFNIKNVSVDTQKKVGKKINNSGQNLLPSKNNSSKNASLVLSDNSKNESKYNSLSLSSCRKKLNMSKSFAEQLNKSSTKSPHKKIDFQIDVTPKRKVQNAFCNSFTESNKRNHKSELSQDSVFSQRKNNENLCSEDIFSSEVVQLDSSLKSRINEQNNILPDIEKEDCLTRTPHISSESAQLNNSKNDVSSEIHSAEEIITKLTLDYDDDSLLPRKFPDLSRIELDHIKEKLDKARRLSPKLREKLENLNIEISWNIPKIHDIYKSLYPGSYHNSGIVPKSGKEGAFEDYENEAITNRWYNFCKLYNFNPKEDFKGFFPASKALRLKEKIKFLQFLGKDIPHRYLHSIYYRFVNLFKTYNKGRFSPEEDKFIMHIYNDRRILKNKDEKYIFSALSSLLHRSRFTIYRRLRRLTRNNQVSMDLSQDHKVSSKQSTLHETVPQDLKRLKESMSRLTDSEDVQILDSFTADSLFWLEIGKKCKLSPAKAKLNYLCKLRPKLLPQEKIPQNNISLIRRIVKRIKKKRWENWSEIDWNLLSRKICDLDPVLLYLHLRRYIKTNVPSKYWETLTDCLEHIDKFLRDDDVTGIKENS